MINRDLMSFSSNFMEDNAPNAKKPLRDVESVQSMMRDTGWDDEDESPQEKEPTKDTEDIEDTEMTDGFFWGGMYSGSTKGQINDKLTEILQEQIDDGKALISAYEEANNIVYEAKATVKDTEEEKKANQRIIDDVKLILSESVKESSKQHGYEKAPHIRKYKNTAKMEKIIYAKPVDANSSGKKKLLLFLICTVCASVFFGIKANSYYVFKEGTASIMSCAFGWFITEGVPMVINPFYMDVFIVTFCIWGGIVLLVGLFVWLDAEQRKQSRVGHEHGKARLGTSRDFKTHKIKFMDR